MLELGSSPRLTLARADTFNLLVTYTPTYPDEPPTLDLDVLEGDVADEEKEMLLAGLNESANESLGMVRRTLSSPALPARPFTDANPLPAHRPWCSRSPSSSRSSSPT